MGWLQKENRAILAVITKEKCCLEWKGELGKMALVPTRKNSPGIEQLQAHSHLSATGDACLWLASILAAPTWLGVHACSPPDVAQAWPGKTCGTRRFIHNYRTWSFFLFLASVEARSSLVVVQHVLQRWRFCISESFHVSLLLSCQVSWSIPTHHNPITIPTQVCLSEDPHCFMCEDIKPQ